MLFVSVPIAGISIWQGDTQDFIQDFFGDEIENEEQSPNSLVEWDVHYAMSPPETYHYVIYPLKDGCIMFNHRWSFKSAYQMVGVLSISKVPKGIMGISVLMRVSTSSFCPFTGHEFELGNDVNENGCPRKMTKL